MATTTPTPTKSLGGSFTKANAQAKPKRRRLIALVQGAQKAGKTYFALDAPGPIAAFMFEPGLEGVVEKFNKKDISVADYIFAEPVAKKERKDKDYLEHIRSQASPIWERFIVDWGLALKSPDVRTVFVDTASALYNLARLAYVGMTGKTESKDDPYGQKSGMVGASLGGLVTEAYKYDKHVIFLAREKEKWVDNEPSGLYEPDGWKHLPYETQVNIRLTRRTDGNETTRKAFILDSRIEQDFAAGLMFTNKEGVKNVAGKLSFTSIAATITGSDESEWA